MFKWLALALTLMTLGSPVLADQVKVMASDDEAAQIRFDLIKQAARGNVKEILFEYFEVGEDSFSLDLLAYLKQVAVNDNVKVKILVDGMFNEMSSKTMAALMEGTGGNLEIRVFNQVWPLEFFDMTRRSHDKLLIVDGERMVIGSRNTAAPYFGLAKNPSKNYRDLDLVVSGRSVKEARRYFLELWNGPIDIEQVWLGRYSDRKRNENCGWRDKSQDMCLSEQATSERTLKKIIAKLDQRAAKLKTSKYLRRNSMKWQSQMREIGEIEFIANETARQVSKKHHRAADQIFAEISKARQRVTIVTPYLFPDKKTLKYFQRLINEQGVEVTMVTNSRISTDSMLAQAAYEEVKNKLIDMGVKLYEFKGPGILHAKSVIIDDRTAIVGSFNFDRRSMYINREVAIAFADQGAVLEDVSKVSQKFIRNSWLVGSNGQAIKMGNDYKKANESRALDMIQAILQLNFPFVRDQI